MLHSIVLQEVVCCSGQWSLRLVYLGGAEEMDIGAYRDIKSCNGDNTTDHSTYIKEVFAGAKIVNRSRCAVDSL